MDKTTDLSYYCLVRKRKYDFVFIWTKLQICHIIASSENANMIL